LWSGRDWEEKKGRGLKRIEEERKEYWKNRRREELKNKKSIRYSIRYNITPNVKHQHETEHQQTSTTTEHHTNKTTPLETSLR
jgi:hypothetical protein